MSREKPRRHIPKFTKGWDADISRAVPDVGYIPGEQLGPWPGPEQIDVNDIPIGARNRSGERRKTGKTFKG